MWDLGYGAGSHLRQWKVCENAQTAQTDVNSGVTAK